MHTGIQMHAYAIHIHIYIHTIYTIHACLHTPQSRLTYAHAYTYIHTYTHIGMCMNRHGKRVG